MQPFGTLGICRNPKSACQGLPPNHSVKLTAGRRVVAGEFAHDTYELSKRQLARNLKQCKFGGHDARLGVNPINRAARIRLRPVMAETSLRFVFLFSGSCDMQGQGEKAHGGEPLDFARLHRGGNRLTIGGQRPHDARQPDEPPVFECSDVTYEALHLQSIPRIAHKYLLPRLRASTHIVGKYSPNEPTMGRTIAQ